MNRKQDRKANRNQKGSWLTAHRYALLLLYLPLYLLLFFCIDIFTDPARVHIIRCGLDALIPFNQYMVIPYAVWFFWFPGWLLFFLLRDREDFIKLAVVMFSGMSISLLIYVIWPNGIELREPITGTDICSRALIMIRSVDSPNGVCPSIHISTITAIALVIKDTKLPDFNATVRGYCIVITLLIAYATMAIKQHSIVDVLCGALLSAVLYILYKEAAKRGMLLRFGIGTDRA